MHAPGYQPIATQHDFPGVPHNDDDVVSAVKPELMLDVRPTAGGAGNQVSHDFVLDTAP